MGVRSSRGVVLAGGRGGNGERLAAILGGETPMEVGQLIRSRWDQSKRFEVLVWREDHGRRSVADLVFCWNVGWRSLLMEQSRWWGDRLVEAVSKIRSSQGYRSSGL